MKRSSQAAFTLMEMLMVMLIISIIAALVVSVAGYANKKAAGTRADDEIHALSSACENYKTDNGTYPRLTDGSGGGDVPPSAGGTEQADDSTDSPIDPRLHGDPTSTKYKNASLFLYRKLSGDNDLDGHSGDSVGGVRNKVYFEFKNSMLGGVTTAKPIGTPGAVLYLQDPYGFSYGYSTAGLKAEDDFRATAAADTTGHPTRSAHLHGYNATFDLWSTGGVQVTDTPTDDTRQRWHKNW